MADILVVPGWQRRTLPNRIAHHCGECDGHALWEGPDKRLLCIHCYRGEILVPYLLARVAELEEALGRLIAGCKRHSLDDFTQCGREWRFDDEIDAARAALDGEAQDG